MERKKVTKWLLCIACCLFMTLQLIPPMAVKAVEGENGDTVHVDVVIVIDDSGSMKHTDPDKLAAEAVCSLVDVLPESGDQVGVVTYGLKVVDELSLNQIRSETDKKVIKKFARSNILQNEEWTNSSAGLAEAVKFLDEFKDENHEQVIILVTDGEDDFGGNTDAEAKAKKNFDTAVNSGYPIYTIGINPQSKSYKAYVKSVADQTEGKYYFPETSEDLDGIFRDILAQASDSYSGDGKTIKINSTDWTEDKETIEKGVFEADIQIKHTGNVEYKVTDPAGNEVSEGASFKVVEETGYTVLKLIEPAAGEWTIALKGDDQTVELSSLIHYYDLSTSVEIGTVAPGENATAKVSLKNSDGEMINVSEYGEFTGVLAITNADGESVAEFPLTVESDVLVADIKIDEAGEYQAVATVVRKSDISISGEATTFTVGGEGAAVGDDGDDTTEATTESKPQGGNKDKVDPQSPTTPKKKGLPVPVIILLIVLGIAVIAAIAFVLIKMLSGRGGNNLTGYISYTIKKDGQTLAREEATLMGKKQTFYDLMDRGDFGIADLRSIVVSMNTAAGVSYKITNTSGIEIRGIAEDGIANEGKEYKFRSMDNAYEISFRIYA